MYNNQQKNNREATKSKEQKVPLFVNVITSLHSSWSYSVIEFWFKADNTNEIWSSSFSVFSCKHRHSYEIGNEQEQTEQSEDRNSNSNWADLGHQEPVCLGLGL